MAEREKKTVKLQVVVDQALAAKIGELAERMGASQSKMAYWLLEAAVDQNELIIKVVTSRFAKAVRETLGNKRRASKTGQARPA